MDRLAFRQMNALQNNMRTVTGQCFETGVGIADCLEALQPAWDAAVARVEQFNKEAEKTGSVFRKGVGVASCWYGCGNTSLPNPSTMRMGLRADGVCVLHQGAMDIGQGANTVIAQIAADALGVPVHSLSLLDGDTDLTPDCGKTSASRQTFVSGKAALLAGRALRETILRHANVSNDASIIIEKQRLQLVDAATGNMANIDLSSLPVDDYGYVFMSEETYDPPTTPLDENGQGSPYAVYGYGAQMIELTVDRGLGQVRLDKMTTAHDVGRAINPLLVEGQIEGGVAQGIGLALMEDYLPGRTENLHDYLIPTIGDIPEFEHIIVEVADAEGPYGAKGLGEHVLIPTAPAIVNAIRQAVGVLITNLPATADKIRAALQAQETGHD
jgi:CO/xanthine dehydrogenase Mo-binding subunit